MISFKAKVKDVIWTRTNEAIVTVATHQDVNADEIYNMIDNELDVKVELSRWREKRSLNANNYCWKMLDEIAKKIKSTKELVYREIIHRVGVFEILPIRNDALESFIRRWQSKGLGWLCEQQRDSTIPNYTVVVAYYGTSTYNTEEMSRFIDEVVEEAKGLGIQTETPDQIAEMKSLWESSGNV